VYPLGSYVRRGEIVALCGSSGRSPRPHLHFQFQSTDQIGEKTIDHPLGYYIEHKSDKQVFRAASVPPEGVEIEPLVHSARCGVLLIFNLAVGGHGLTNTEM
jgi:murein DD-endopeptidase MepM/ murein hydrolase activator NlpD